MGAGQSCCGGCGPAAGGTAGPASRAPAAPGCALGDNNPGGPAAADGPATPAGPVAVAEAAALLRAAQDAAEALAAPDPDLDRERAEIAAGLRTEAPDPTRAGLVEVLPNGTRLRHCRVCGRLAAWSFGVAPVIVPL